MAAQNSDEQLVGTITSLLREARGGAKPAVDNLFNEVYQHLKVLARGQLARAPQRDKRVEATALVNAACEKLLTKGPLEAEDRRHFFFLFGRAMHDVIVEQARHDLARKRGGDAHRTQLVDLPADARLGTADVLDIHNALEALKAADPDAAQVVELRFFGGRTLEEAAEIMGSTFAIARGHWDYARAWLRERLSDRTSGD